MTLDDRLLAVQALLRTLIDDCDDRRSQVHLEDAESLVESARHHLRVIAKETP